MDDRFAAKSNDTKVRAFFESLTGPSRGQVHWLSGDAIDASVDNDGVLLLQASEPEADTQDTLAQLNWTGASYMIEVPEGQDVWVNGRKTHHAQLLHGDMVEFGETGPMSRYRLCDKSFPTHWSADDILSDAVAYARTSRRPFASRMSTATFETVRRIALQTTVVFRITVILSLLLLGTLGYVLYENDRTLRASMELEAKQLQAITAALSQAREEALTPEDLAALRTDLDTRLSTNAERLAALERRSQASARVIRNSARSVVFLQGAFGLRHEETGRLLRHVLGPDGERLNTPFGQPLITPDGTGDPAEFQFTGTGFLLVDGRHLVTNRHVARPWTSGDKMRAFQAGGLAPEMLKMVAYLPGSSGPVPATLLQASETADVAILTLETGVENDRGLALADAPPRPGDEVILMGYPTGLRALLAQAGSAFLESLQEAGDTDFWAAAQRMSESDLIMPLASRGIIAQVTANAVIYDAETTVGGSGGPALNSDGQVVAINAAILPEFGGSNIGVPVAELRQLLEHIGAE